MENLENYISPNFFNQIINFKDGKHNVNKYLTIKVDGTTLGVRTHRAVATQIQPHIPYERVATTCEDNDELTPNRR